MNAIKKLITIVQEDIIGTGNRIIAMSWLVALTGVIVFGFYLSSESMSFMGVSGSREFQVTFEYPVEIKRLHVMPGQVVRRGDLLAELDQSELNGKIRLTRSMLGKIEAEMKVRKHLNILVSNGTSEDGDADPLMVDAADLREELALLERAKRNLYVFAEVDGVVGAVNYKKGEKVPNFMPLLTLSPESPTFVEGFVHESLHTRLEVGRTVTVKPVTSSTQPVQGRIISVGSRIIMMPLRLTLYPNQQVWGREVVVEIPEHSGLLMNEKVQIKPDFEMFKLPLVIAATEMAKANTAATAAPASTAKADGKPQEMRMPAQLERRFDFEPSGVIYLPDVKKFLVVSDDTDKQKSASLFMVDRDGRIEDQTLFIPGVGEISDLESISQSGDYVYMMTSQGLNKKGKDKPERNLFVRAKRAGLEMTETEVLNFKPMLMKMIAASSDAKLKATFKGARATDFEIESHFVEDNFLYIGFKTPLSSAKETLMLVIQDVDRMFKTKNLEIAQLSSVKWVDFGQVAGAPHHMSDLIRVKGRMYATTVCHHEGCGAIWRLSESEGKITAEQLKSFEDLKPEGIAFDPEDSSFFVTFDLKDQPAKFLRIPLVESGVNSNDRK
ncbi:MAG: HlyD family efflux transporter periplasmic adaptor subunit [Bdellovibrionaceae bacterium]|nr:HlyD family efflux transporter periplasmic adaptor subunit [Pseudobdellovibrionaceae bacterium]